MDLVGRKLMDGGAAAFAVLDRIETTKNDALRDAVSDLRKLTEWMVGQDMQDRFAGSVSYLNAFARVLGVHYHLKAAESDDARAPLARFAAGRMLPEALAEMAKARTGAGELYAVSNEVIAA